ncbi:MAG TPA: glycoside hydrolase family 13 protein [Phycisphaerae bacterium]|nr:glycoside hydrolase family 13 protein [Phycisphaerae bacterium]
MNRTPWRRKAPLLAGLLIMATESMQPTIQAAEAVNYASTYDVKRGEVLAAREADWRNGAIVYQVFVDRFAPANDLDAKRSLYAAPRRLRTWDEQPTRGSLDETAGVWSHELDFWGGDLASLRGKLDYIQHLGADVLYLNPICQALTNHKYDAQDYFTVAPEYGTRADVAALATDLHGRDMRLVLDGVFNHVGRTSPWFLDAVQDPESPYRNWFYIGDEYADGHRGWADVANLPELCLENPAVRARIWGDADSVVQSYLRDGVDGWRLDVATDLGFNYLAELTRAAHAARPGSLVVGENWVYPEEWSPSLDAVMNFYYRQILVHLLAGEMSGAHAGRLIERMIADTGLDPVLKAWVILDNHDLARIGTVWPKPWRRHMAQALQFTLPGSPCVYYGAELGMTGGDDPEMRGPMRWDLATDANEELAWMRRLIALRRGNRALRIGDFRLLDSERVLAFMRRTDRAADTTVIVANATGKTVTDVLPIRDSKVMNWGWLIDELGDVRVQVKSGIAKVEVPAHTVCVLRPEIPAGRGHNPYKRMQ